MRYWTDSIFTGKPAWNWRQGQSMGRKMQGQSGRRANYPRLTTQPRCSLPSPLTALKHRVLQLPLPPWSAPSAPPPLHLLQPLEH